MDRMQKEILMSGVAELEYELKDSLGVLEIFSTYNSIYVTVSKNFTDYEKLPDHVVGIGVYYIQCF